MSIVRFYWFGSSKPGLLESPKTLVIFSEGKNHRTRVVVLPQLAYDYLGELLFDQIVENNGICPDDLIFTHKGKPIHPDTFSRHLRKLYDRNGFPKDYHLHTMRHFFATYLLENGTSKQVTADLLGHADTGFSSAPTATRRTPARSRQRGSWIPCCSQRMPSPGNGNKKCWKRETRKPIKPEDKKQQGSRFIQGFPIVLSMKMTVMTLMTLILVYPHARGTPTVSSSPSSSSLAQVAC